MNFKIVYYEGLFYLSQVFGGKLRSQLQPLNLNQLIYLNHIPHKQFLELVEYLSQEQINLLNRTIQYVQEPIPVAALQPNNNPFQFAQEPIPVEALQPNNNQIQFVQEPIPVEALQPNNNISAKFNFHQFIIPNDNHNNDNNDLLKKEIFYQKITCKNPKAIVNLKNLQNCNISSIKVTFILRENSTEVKSDKYMVDNNVFEIEIGWKYNTKKNKKNMFYNTKFTFYDDKDKIILEIETLNYEQKQIQRKNIRNTQINIAENYLRSNFQNIQSIPDLKQCLSNIQSFDEYEAQFTREEKRNFFDTMFLYYMNKGHIDNNNVNDEFKQFILNYSTGTYTHNDIVLLGNN